MKKIHSIIFLVFLSVVSWGQSDELENTSSAVHYQIGTDISPLFKSLLKPENDQRLILNAPYIFLFKSWKNDKAFRFGIGFDRKQEIGEDNSDDKVLQNSIRVRMGFEKQKKLSKRWQINSGIDLKFSSSKFEDSNNSSFDNQSKTHSLSPLVGIQFQLTSHLYLQTEASFNLYYQTSSFDSNFDIIFPGPFPTFSASELKSFGGFITIPNALLLVVEF